VNRDAPGSLTQPACESLWDQVKPKAHELTRQQLIDGALDYVRAVALEKGELWSARFQLKLPCDKKVA
jgi:hypothetical protein